MGGGARRGQSGFRRQRPVGRRVALAVTVYPPSGDHLVQLRRRYRTTGCQPACRTPDRTLVNAPTARSRQAACRCPLIRLPDAAIGVPLLRAAAQAARYSRPMLCASVCMVVTPGGLAVKLLAASTNLSSNPPRLPRVRPSVTRPDLP